MDAMFALLLAAGGGSVAYLIAWLMSQERGREWMNAATAAGLAELRLGTFAGVTSSLKGKAGGLDVTIEHYRRGKHEHGTRIVVGGLKHGQYGMTLRAEGVTSMVEKTFGEREIEIGDPAFDRFCLPPGLTGTGAGRLRHGNPRPGTAAPRRQTRRRERRRHPEASSVGVTGRTPAGLAVDDTEHRAQAPGGHPPRSPRHRPPARTTRRPRGAHCRQSRRGTGGGREIRRSPRP